ncbi:XdhC family protein, partial [Pseudomonas syringae pv. tagetis]
VVRYGEGGFAPTRGLPCGGVLDVLIESFGPSPEADALLAAIEQALAGRELVCRQVQLGTGLSEIGPATMREARIHV